MSCRFDGMVRCGCEGTAAIESLRHPLDLMRVEREGVRTKGPTTPELDLDLSNQRPAADVHSTHVEREPARISAADPAGMKRVQRAA